MKILHICLAGSYNDNWGYQDNLIPKYHLKAGHDVTVITSIFINSTKHSGYEKVKKGEYYLDNGLKIIRIPFRYFRIIPKKFSEKMRIYKCLFDNLEKEKPDFIFIHGLQFLDIFVIIKYLNSQKRNIEIVVDNHADYDNSATNWLSKNILHKKIWRFCAQAILPYTHTFYGVLPVRVKFMEDIYKIPKCKTDLLVLGADTEKVNLSERKVISMEIRNKYNINKDSFLITTGGKFTKSKKEILTLLNAFRLIENKNIELMIFGSISEEIKQEFQNLIDDERIHYIGWIDSNEVYQYFHASNLVIFPSTHSVLWEQAVGTGVPCVFKYWEGKNHLDVGGNCKFLYNNTVKEVLEVVTPIVNNPYILSEMKTIARTRGVEKFSYKEISQKVIDDVYTTK